MIDTPLRQIQELFAKARKRVIIISAFVGSEALDLLLKAAKQVSDRSVYARWDWHDIASGASDWRAWDVAHRHNAPMFACPGLHAKAYIGDNKALIGSANATTPGLSGLPDGNLELLVPESADTVQVEQVVRRIKAISSLARPMGDDITRYEPQPSDRSDDAYSIWLPKSAPDRFLSAMTGHASHDAESAQDKTALRLGESVSGRTEIRKTVFDTTVFRVVRSAFEGRVLPMDIAELRTLLASQASPTVQELPEEQLRRLCQWLGEFGENTVMGPSTDPSSAQLKPGRLLSSEHFA
ncbi:MAG: phospholipase D family protein [Rhodobacteraceae bacterium]|nr:phospholipase D family protein [Gammaproteobacteria bacterium]MCY4327553.1 phospholipase D family protein [Paracoccaceae bacterium]